LISHDIDVIQELSDQYIFIDEGRLVYSGFTVDINQSDHPKLKAIIAAGQ
jgi:ABC-type glutathione transport system ATPase component